MSETTEKLPEEPKASATIPLASGLPAEIRKTIEQVAGNPGVAVEPQQLEKAFLAVMSQISVYYTRQGPLPPPQELAEYERILPGAADRIISSSEKQMNHRIELEARTVSAQNQQSGRGQVFGFIIAIVALLCSFGAIWAGHSVAGTILGTVDLVALVSVFVIGKSGQRTDLQRKAKAVPDPGTKR